MLHQDITVLITSFKSDKKIAQCLKSINPKINIIVIENSNNLEFKTRIEKEFSNCKCVLAGENLGYAKGNNLGLKKIKTKFALILNPDALLSFDAIDNFLITAKKNKDFALIGPLVQEQHKDTEHNIHDKPELIEVNNIKGFAMFLNISQFESIGFFDSNFFIYFEEIDLCRRLKENNKKIYLDPSIKINHAGGSSHDKDFNFEMELSRNWHWMWSKFYYNKKYYGYPRALLKVLPNLFSAILKTFFYFISKNETKKLIYFHRMSGLINSILNNKSWYRPKVN
jgi:N-acetylglucosaminyl-diphospho-decaprenol L-rhamnosyltransferase